MEANLADVHVSRFLQVGPRCVNHVDVVHLTAWHHTTLLALIYTEHKVLLNVSHTKNSRKRLWQDIAGPMSAGRFKVLALVEPNQTTLGSFRHSVLVPDIWSLYKSQEMIRKGDLYLECCCFSPAARSLSAPPAGYHLSYDPRKDTHSAINNSVPTYNSPCKIGGLCPTNFLSSVILYKVFQMNKTSPLLIPFWTHMRTFPYSIINDIMTYCTN